MENSLLTLTNLRELFWGKKANSEHLLLNRLDTPNIHIPSSHYNTSEHIPFPVITPRTKQSVFLHVFSEIIFRNFCPINIPHKRRPFGVTFLTEKEL